MAGRCARVCSKVLHRCGKATAKVGGRQSPGRVAAAARMRRPSQCSGSPAVLGPCGLAHNSLRSPAARCVQTECAIPVLEARGYARGRKALCSSAAQRAFATTRPVHCQHRSVCAPLVPRVGSERARPAGARPHWRCRAAQPNRVAHRSRRCVERAMSEHRAQLAAAGGQRPAGVRGRVARESRFGEQREEPERSEGLRLWGRVPAPAWAAVRTHFAARILGASRLLVKHLCQPLCPRSKPRRAHSGMVAP